jgi:hypothetical protein
MLCGAVSGWMWWQARADGYAGLPVNTLGQILGDLLLMGLAAPVINHSRHRGRQHEANGGTLLSALAQAAHRVQLLDDRVCLGELGQSTAPGSSAVSTAAAYRSQLLVALASAMENDAHIEILLPDPEHLDSCGADRLPDADVGLLRAAVDSLMADLAALTVSAALGRLDVRLYSTMATVSMIRCDDHVWACLHPMGTPHTASYLAVDAQSENARVLYHYFHRLQAHAREVAHAHDGPPVRRAQHGGGSSPAVD